MFSITADVISESLTEILDNVSRANISAVTALNALCNIDLSQCILDNDRICRAFTLALHAANASYIAHLHNCSTLIVVRACRHDLLSFGDELNDALGAGISTGTAANAAVSVDLCNTILDVNCIKLAGSCAVAKTNASEGAGLVALAAKQHCCLAVLRTAVVEALLGIAAGASNMCNHLNSVSTAYAHDLGDLCSSLGTACYALIGSSFALGNSSSVTITAGESAAAAVCACKAFTNCFLLGIDLNMENLCCECKQSSEKCTQCTENNDRKKNNSHTLVPPIRKSSFR